MNKTRTIAALAAALAMMALIAAALWRQAPVRVSVTLVDYRIEASHTWVKKGDLVALTVTNRGHDIHELEVEGYDQELEDLLPGETRTLTFRADRSGPLVLVCRLADHFERGMRTTIQVQD